MLPSGFFKVSAILLIAGGILGVAGTVLSPTDDAMQETVNNPMFVPASLMLMLAGLLTVVGLPAVYARIARPGGALALIGVIALMITGIMLGFFPGVISALLFPWLAGLQIPEATLEEGPATLGMYWITGSIIALIGSLAFGLAIVRSNVLSRWPGYLLLAAGAVNLVTFFLPEESPAPVWMIAPALFNVALAWLGVEVWRTTAEAREVPATRREDMAA